MNKSYYSSNFKTYKFSNFGIDIDILIIYTLIIKIFDSRNIFKLSEILQIERVWCVG